MTASLRPVSGTPSQLQALLTTWLDAPTAEPLIVRTSGSSGHPKDVVLSRDALLASADAAHRRLGGPGQWLAALPAQSVGGLQVLIRSIRGGQPAVYADDFESLGAARAAMTGERTYVSVVPTHVHRLARSGALDHLAGFDAVLLGGAPAPADLVTAAREAGVTIVRTYGMSETSGGCVYDGVPLDGVGLRIAADGQVHLSGPTLFDGYSGDPEATDAVLSNGWFATADLGEVDESGRLHIVGRLDDVVISGGVNIALPGVTAALRRCEGVDDVSSVGVEDAEWGQRVVACVVGSASLDELRGAVEAADLPRSHAPRQLVRLDSLPLLPGGKVDRLALHALAAEAGH